MAAGEHTVSNYAQIGIRLGLSVELCEKRQIAIKRRASSISRKRTLSQNGYGDGSSLVLILIGPNRSCQEFLCNTPSLILPK